MGQTGSAPARFYAVPNQIRDPCDICAAAIGGEWTSLAADVAEK